MKTINILSFGDKRKQTLLDRLKKKINTEKLQEQIERIKDGNETNEEKILMKENLKKIKFKLKSKIPEDKEKFKIFLSLIDKRINSDNEVDLSIFKNDINFMKKLRIVKR